MFQTRLEARVWWLEVPALWPRSPRQPTSVSFMGSMAAPASWGAVVTAPTAIPTSEAQAEAAVVDYFRPCNKCGTPFPHTSEYFRFRAPGKLRAVCRSCHNTYRRAWSARNADRLREQKRRRYAADPTSHRARSAAFKAGNGDSIHAYNAGYRATHLREHAAYQRNRKARARMAPGTHNAADVTAQLLRQRGRCYWCHKNVGQDYHVDHVVPLCRGGSNGPENLVIACVACNLHKRATHPMDFAGVML